MAKLQVTELDFDDIKDNLKNFLKAQNKFKDYVKQPEKCVEIGTNGYNLMKDYLLMKIGKNC